MLRIVHCIYDDPGNPWVAGGGALRAWEIYRRLSGAVDATVVSGNYPGARDEIREGVRYVRLGAPSPYPWSRLTYARAATRLLAQGNFDAAIFDFSVYTPVRLPEAKAVGTVVHMLHGLAAYDRFGPVLGAVVRAAERRALRHPRVISATSQWLTRKLRQIVPESTRIELIGSGVSEEFSLVQRREADFFLYYGRFDVYHKGIDLLLDAFMQIVHERPMARLVMAGRGKDAARVMTMVRERALASHVEVRLNPSRGEVLEWMAGAIALLMPSRMEGLPMVPAEAMSAGVPVIASDVGATAEVVDPPSGGVLIPAEDASALAAAAIALWDDPERRSALERSARASARRFSWETVAHRHLDFLRTLADSSPPADFV